MLPPQAASSTAAETNFPFLERFFKGRSNFASSTRDSPCLRQRRDRCCRNPASCRRRSEEHTSELQSLMRISYAVFCLKKKKNTNTLIKKVTHQKSSYSTR